MVLLLNKLLTKRLLQLEKCGILPTNLGKLCIFNNYCPAKSLSWREALWALISPKLTQEYNKFTGWVSYKVFGRTLNDIFIPFISATVAAHLIRRQVLQKIWSVELKWPLHHPQATNSLPPRHHGCPASLAQPSETNNQKAWKHLLVKTISSQSSSKLKLLLCSLAVLLLNLVHAYSDAAIKKKLPV